MNLPSVFDHQLPFCRSFTKEKSPRHQRRDLPPLRRQVPRQGRFATDRGADDQGVQAVLVLAPGAGENCWVRLKFLGKWMKEKLLEG
jgi:hypothetical protein